MSGVIIDLETFRQKLVLALVAAGRTETLAADIHAAEVALAAEKASLELEQLQRRIQVAQTVLSSLISDASRLEELFKIGRHNWPDAVNSFAEALASEVAHANQHLDRYKTTEAIKTTTEQFFKKMRSITEKKDEPT